MGPTFLITAEGGRPVRPMSRYRACTCAWFRRKRKPSEQVPQKQTDAKG